MPAGKEGTMEMENLSRRNLLKLAGAGMMGATAAGFLAGCGPVPSESKSVGASAEGASGHDYSGLEVQQSEAYAVVAGGGAAGLMAAYKLAKEGKKPLVIEKGASCASSNFAKLSGPAACDTTVQAASGITLATKLNVYNQLTTWAKGSVNTKLISNLLDYSSEAVQDLLDMGLTFYTYVDYTGDPKYANDIKWAPLHNFTQEGEERIAPVVAAIEDLGGSFIYNCEATEVIMEGGKVAGIRAIEGGKVLHEISTPAVFLATGGFGGSEEMVKDLFKGIPVCNMGTPNNTGDGIRMAHEVGAVSEEFAGLVGNEICGSNVKHGNAMYDENWNLNNENLAFAIYGGLVLDKTGERFMNEELLAVDPLVYSGQAGLAQGKYYVLVDGEYYDACTEEGVYSYLGEPDWDFGREMFYPVLSAAPGQFEAAVSEGWAAKGDTIAEVAEVFGLDHLEETVAAYNALCQAGKDTQFGKDPMFLTPIKEGKGYYLFEYNAAYWTTLGGVRTNDHLIALTGDNEPIEGLYIGGVNMGSAFCRPYYDIKGAACGLSIASGVMAATEMISYIEG